MSTKRAVTGATASAPKRRKTIPMFSTTHCINRVPEMVWQYEIISYLDFTQFSNLRCHSTFNDYWLQMRAKNIIRVPQECHTVQQAMKLAMFFNTAGNTLRIVLEKGIHEIVGNYKRLTVTYSHITFVGKGKDQTTIHGGFEVHNQQNVKFEELAVMNQSWHGLMLVGSNTTVNVLKCAVKECMGAGMWVSIGATVTATQCEFMENGEHGVFCDANTKARLNDCQMHHNGGHGLWADGRTVVDLHGTKTDIHSNKSHGILAFYDAKVNIHLPSQHNTSHDNVGDDRNQVCGGSIANINADGTFTHVVVEEDDY